MDRVEKAKQIDFLKSVFSNSESMILTGVEGLQAGQLSGLRKKLRESEVRFQVVKNKLAKIALKETGAAVLNDDFVGSTAVAWSEKDAVAPAKILVDFQKEEEDFLIKSGFNSGQRLDIQGIKTLASLPSLKELQAQLLGLMKAVPTKMVAQISAPSSHLVGVLQAKVEKEKESAT